MVIGAMPATNVTPKKERQRTRVRGASAKRKLARAFQTFTYAADSLEKSYGNLQAEVLRLRFELERTNCDLATSLEENSRMRGYLARVIEGLPCGVVVADRRGQIRMTNPEARRLLPEIAQVSSQETPSIEQAPTALRNYLQESREGGAPTERDWAIETPEGARTIGLSCTVLGEVNGEGTSSESVFLLRDITEEKKRAAERELARRRESLAEMATLLAHEIRNPLGSLELFAGLLADAAATQPDLRRWTDHIQAGLRSLSATVNNVLQFHSQPPPQLAPVNLGRLMRDSVEFLRPLARQAALRIDLQNFLGELEVPADAHRLQQLFFNLALNAFRAMSAGGVLTVRMQWADLNRMDEVRIHFEDTGRGIAAEDLPKVFEAGFTTHAGNPGLGLAVCRAVAQQHGGEIRVASEPGMGTTFSLILPRVGRLA
jgi:two-component system sensor histidine kinase FlrB